MFSLWQFKIRQPIITPFLLAVLLHILVFILIFYAFVFNSDKPIKVAAQGKPVPKIVQAIALKQSDIDAEVAKLEQQQQQQTEAREAAAHKIAAAKAELQRQQQRTARALAALAAQRKTQQSELQKLQQQRQLLAQQQAEQDLQRKLEAQQKADKALAASQLQSLLSKYNSLILNAIYPNWIVSQQDKSLSCDLLISLAANGTVLNVTVQNSSGVPAFDRSAVAAVYKSSPLPVPNTAAAFAHFRQFKLTMRPENVVSTQ